MGTISLTVTRRSPVSTRSSQSSKLSERTMNQTLCKLEEVSVMVGPLQVFESIGHWNTAVLVILALHLLPVWAVAATLLCRLSSSVRPGLRLTSALLITVPPALMSIATAGIVVPSTGVIVEILHE